MSRTVRVIELGGIYHVTSRGNDGRLVFLDETDFQRFIALLDKVAWRYGWLVLGYCLMDNHVHLLVEVPADGLSSGMQELLSGYACWWNQRHGHSGHLFRNRFYAKQVRGESQLFTTACYIDLNPVTAKMRSSPDEWRWSSYRAHIGLEHPPDFLATGEFWKLVGPTPDAARATYEQFVASRLKAVSDADLSAPKLAADQG